MAEDQGKVELLRDALGDAPFSEKRMFGGTCFMLRGHMVCGTLKTGAMFRVGKQGDGAALALPGVRPMNFTGRLMAGFTECDEDTLGNDSVRSALLDLALTYNKTLLPK